MKFIHPHRGFTLLELLIVVAIIGLLMSLLVPGISGAREQAKTVTCSTNLRQLSLANQFYADENHEQLCPAAPQYLANLRRWHGTRDDIDKPFDPRRGPLSPYLSDDGLIRKCPSFQVDLDYYADNPNIAFELNTGGYGYNNEFVGRQIIKDLEDQYQLITDEIGQWAHRIGRPDETLMFSDSAFASEKLIEYSFAEPRFWALYPAYRIDPSIHFRHRKQCNIVWCDGHLDRQERSFSWSSGYFPLGPASVNIGWFGDEDSNRFFDLD